MKKLVLRALTGLLAVMLVFGALPIAAQGLPELILGAEMTAGTDGASAEYRFAPQSAGAYAVTVRSDIESVYFSVYDASGTQLITEWAEADGGGKYMFYLNGECTLELGFSGSGEYTLLAETAPLVQEFSLFIANEFGSVKDYTACIGLNEVISTNKPQGVDAYLGRLEFTSSDPQVAEADYRDSYTPVIIPKAAGKADITARAVSGAEYTFHLRVTEPEQTVLSEQKVRSLPGNGAKYSFYYAFTPAEGGEYAFVAYDSPNESMYFNGYVYDGYGRHVSNFSRSYNGAAELIAGETYFIKLSAETYYGTPENRTLTFCIEKTVAPEELKLTYVNNEEITETDMYKGTKLYLNSRIYPLHAKAEEIIWSSGNPEIAEITSTYAGSVEITAVGTGSTVITAETESGLSASVTVRVSEMRALEEGENFIEYSPELTGRRVVMSFTPKASGYYRISSDGIYAGENAQVNYSVTDSNYNYIAQGSINSWNNAAVSCELNAGEKYTVEFDFYNIEAAGNFNFNLAESLGVVSLEIVSPPHKTVYIKGECDYPDMSGLEAKATFSDGSEAYWSYDESGNSGDMAGYGVETYAVNDENGYFTEVVVKCAGLEAAFPLTILESPVESIEYLGGSIELFENIGGYFNGGYFSYNYSLDGEWIMVKYKSGKVSLFEIKQSDNLEIGGYQLIVNDNQWETGGWTPGGNNYVILKYLGAETRIPVDIKTAGSVGITGLELVSGEISVIENVGGYESEGEYIYFPDVSSIVVRVNYSDGSSKEAKIYEQIGGIGFEYDFEQQQREKPWVLGAENFAEVSYCGVTCRIPVEVTANTVKSIRLIAPEDPGYVFGDLSCGVNSIDEYGNYAFYLNPRIEDGYRLEVTYTDGSVKTYTAEDRDEQGYINGVSCWLESDPITSAGKAAVYVNYCEIKASAEVDVAPSPVRSIEVLKQPQKPKYSFMTDTFAGMELKINYTNNSSKTVTVTEDMAEVYRLQDGFNGPEAEIRVCIDGHPIIIVEDYESGASYLAYRGAVAELENYSPEYGYENVEKAEFIKLKKDVLGSVLRYTFSDGTMLDVTLDADLELSENSYAAKTPYGYLEFGVEADGTLWVAGVYSSLEMIFKSGDLNGDGELDVRDLVRLKKYLAGVGELESSADFDCSGSVAAADLAEMRKALMEAAVLSTVKGDINADGKADKTDLRLFELWLEGTEIPMPLAADMNGDGVIDRADAKLLEQQL